jgi:hypothetical protein
VTEEERDRRKATGRDHPANFAMVEAQANGAYASVIPTIWKPIDFEKGKAPFAISSMEETAVNHLRIYCGRRRATNNRLSEDINGSQKAANGRRGSSSRQTKS